MIPWLKKKAPKRNEIIDVTLQFPYCWNGQNPHHWNQDPGPALDDVVKRDPAGEGVHP